MPIFIFDWTENSELHQYWIEALDQQAAMRRIIGMNRQGQINFGRIDDYIEIKRAPDFLNEERVIPFGMNDSCVSLLDILTPEEFLDFEGGTE